MTYMHTYNYGGPGCFPDGSFAHRISFQQDGTWNYQSCAHQDLIRVLRHNRYSDKADALDAALPALQAVQRESRSLRGQEKLQRIASVVRDSLPNWSFTLRSEHTPNVALERAMQGQATWFPNVSAEDLEVGLMMLFMSLGVMM